MRAWLRRRLRPVAVAATATASMAATDFTAGMDTVAVGDTVVAGDTAAGMVATVDAATAAGVAMVAIVHDDDIRALIADRIVDVTSFAAAA